MRTDLVLLLFAAVVFLVMAFFFVWMTRAVP